MIFVVNKKKIKSIKNNSVVIKITRPSVLSNIFSNNPNSAAKIITKTRKEAIDGYKEYFLSEVKKENSPIRKEIIEIYKTAQKKHIYLMCACKPSSCHGDVIKEFLDNNLKDKIYKE